MIKGNISIIFIGTKTLLIFNKCLWEFNVPLTERAKFYFRGNVRILQGQIMRLVGHLKMAQ